MIYLIIFLLILFSVLLFIKAFDFIFVLNTSKQDVRFLATWFDSFLKIVVKLKGNMPYLSIYLLRMRIYEGKIKPKKQKVQEERVNYLKIFNPEYVSIEAKYGFSDPYNTGIACGVINIISTYLNKITVKQIPEFSVFEDHVYLKTKAKVNMGRALIRLTKQKI